MKFLLEIEIFDKNEVYNFYTSKNREKHLLIYTLNRAKIDVNIKLERTIKLKNIIEKMRVYQDGGVLFCLNDSKFACRDLNSPDVELSNVVDKVWSQ